MNMPIAPPDPDQMDDLTELEQRAPSALQFYQWMDCNGHPENILSRDELLDNVMLIGFPMQLLHLQESIGNALGPQELPLSRYP